MSWEAAGVGGGGGGGEASTTHDFARNFGDEEDGDEEYEDAREEQEGEEGEYEYDEEDGEGELFPGVYRAAYAFEPEGTAEMRLVQGQEVRVLGRGGGVGWAVCVDEGGGPAGEGRHALVPESYLEVVRLDGDDGDGGGDGGGARLEDVQE
ncbi:hypothetical protein C8J57DRAFT_1309292 [Mycena rebaudengoi]|nr:hypothetical protein C8J57DRAFT_1309292 [Mycena rebaudengoi]